MDKKAGLDADYITAVVKQRLEKDTGANVQLYNEIKTKECRASDFLTTDALISDITGRINYRVEAAVISVNGERKAVLKTQAEADGLLEGISSMYYDDNLNIISWSFEEVVDVIMEYVDRNVIIPADQAQRILTASELVQDTHTVVYQENLTTIRNLYNMTESEILAINPGIDKDRLSPGQVLNVTKSKPLVSVRTVAEMVSSHPIKYATKTQNNDNQPKSFSRVLVQGKDGQENITERIIRVNGLEQSREILNRTTIVIPQDEVIEKGTK
jgi:LysM repeat protein